MFCKHCGTALPPSARVCSKCGTVVSAAEDSPIREQITTPLPPTHPVQKRTHPLRIAAFIGILVLIAAIAAALALFRPWMARANPIGGSSSAAISSSNNAADPPAEHPDWEKYTGNWSAGGIRFSLSLQDDKLTVALHADSETYTDVVKIQDDPDSVTLRLDGARVQLQPRKSGTLSVIFDGKSYDAILSNDRPPEADTDKTPTLHADADSGYLFYSPSTGTHSVNDVIPQDNPDLHFWPLDQFAISTADLDRLTRKEIDIIRNETFARHGYVFESEEWADFFSSYNWYQPDPSFTEDGFTSLEKQNVDAIVAYEDEKGWL